MNSTECYSLSAIDMDMKFSILVFENKDIAHNLLTELQNHLSSFKSYCFLDDEEAEKFRNNHPLKKYAEHGLLLHYHILNASHFDIETTLLIEEN